VCYGRLVTQQDPESARSRSPWLIVLGFIVLVLVAMILLKACPKPVPAAAPTHAGQPAADAAEQKHKGELAAG